MNTSETVKKQSVLIVAFILSFGVGIPRAHAVDDFGPMNPPQVIPYRGYVEVDGQAFNGTLQMRFTLSEDSTVDRESGFLWQSAPVDVSVFQGEFSTPLGAPSGLSPDVLDHDLLYLGIDIRPSETDDWVVLSNAQRLVPVPYAYMAAQSRDLSVGGDLDVSGEVEWGYNGAQLVDVDGGAIDFRFLGTSEDYNVRLINDADGQLSLVNGDLEIGGSRITSAGDATIGGDLSVDGDFNNLFWFGGFSTLQVHCPGGNDCQEHMELGNTTTRNHQMCFLSSSTIQINDAEGVQYSYCKVNWTPTFGWRLSVSTSGYTSRTCEAICLTWGGDPPTCGDGLCSQGETNTGCIADCGP